MQLVGSQTMRFSPIRELWTPVPLLAAWRHYEPLSCGTKIFKIGGPSKALVTGYAGNRVDQNVFTLERPCQSCRAVRAVSARR